MNVEREKEKEKGEGGEMKSFSIVEVSKHQSPKDCWIIVAGGVFDVTSYLYKHPGLPKNSE